MIDPDATVDVDDVVAVAELKSNGTLTAEEATRVLVLLADEPETDDVDTRRARFVDVVEVVRSES